MPPERTRADAVADAPEGELAVPTEGELVEMTAVVPSAAAQRADAKGRVGNTVSQVGVPTGVVIIGTWLARLAGIDLDPSDVEGAVQMPTEVTGAFIAVGTWAMARWMNRDGLAATD